ncbi:MAG: 1,4-dihydroxy-2-naphthoate octaprenyltransferase [Myxococcales bacterium]|nr:1,4-dihydroxy-2-naphthoate octaprenyltransferase [Myxococcales bacterium]
MPVAVGAGLSVGHPDARWSLALAALGCAVFVQVGCNLVNDYADFAKGADGADRLGPARATAQGWFSARQVAAGAALALGLAVALGSVAVAARGWPLAAVGLASVLAAVAYTAGPWPLGYLGLGDVFVLGFFGFAAVAGTVFAITGGVDARAWPAGLAVGALATAILVVNNLRDRHTDARVGKRTLAVRFGARFARGEYTALVGLAYLAPVAVAIATGAPGWLLPLVSLPLAVRAAAAVRRTDGAALNPLLGATARVELLFGLLLAVGVSL